jgi:hypothetical protein
VGQDDYVSKLFVSGEKGPHRLSGSLAIRAGCRRHVTVVDTIAIRGFYWFREKIKMPIDKTLWVETFHHSSVPLLPCPHCKHGRLTLSDPDLKKTSPEYNKHISDHPDFEPD